MTDWRDLSDDELLTRLRPRLTDASTAAALVAHRDDDETAAAIDMILRAR